jgi:hypothetical protein
MEGKRNIEVKNNNKCACLRWENEIGNAILQSRKKRGKNEEAM